MVVGERPFRADRLRGRASLSRRRSRSAHRGPFLCRGIPAAWPLRTSTALGAGGANMRVRGGTRGARPLAKCGHHASVEVGALGNAEDAVMQVDEVGGVT